MKRLLTLALVLGTLASAFATSARRGTGVMAQQQPLSTTRTINLNTGYDQWLQPTPDRIAVGQKDNEWRVITDSVNGVPPPSLATGRPADVVSDNIWGSFQAGNFPNSRWVSVTPNQGAPLPTPPPSGPYNEFQYAYYFTLPVGFSNPVLTMKLSADDHVTKVTLNNHTLFQGSGGIFINPPLMIPTLANPTTPSDFMSGSDVNVLTVDVEDTAGGITGLIVDGTVTYVDCDRPALKDTPGLNSITFWEGTSGVTPHTFAAMGPELTTKRTDPLSSSNKDFEGVPDEELYDVFYSEWDGTFSLTGQFVTIEAVWDRGAPSGGGLNIGRVDLNIGTGATSANSVMSFIVLGDNALPGNVGRAVDSDPGVPLTLTTMGNTIGQTQRLRLTVGLSCCVPPPPNMVAWWPADGNANDITPSPDNGVLNGGATFATGEVAQAFSLNGATAYVSAPTANKTNFGTGDFSIDAWIKTTSNTGVHAIVDKRVGNNVATFTGYHLFTFNGNLAVQLADGTFFNFISTKNVADGAFHHVAATVVRNSATGGHLYVDGMSVLTFNPTGRPGSLTNNAELRIGRNCPNTVLDTFFNGLIDEVELFNRALSAAEVQGIFSAGSQGKCKCTITCPANITVSNDLNQCGAVVTYPAPTSSAGCGTVTCSPPSTSFFPVGTTTVTCSTTAGQSCTFTVTVNDTQPPSITCPPNITARTATINDPCVVVSFAPVAIDNCPGVTQVCSPPSMSCFPVGTTTVTCTATDASGNTATCSFTVTVFNVCLQDDSNASIVFLGNTVTGAYRFCCGGLTFTGVAQVTKKGNIATFQQNGLDRRVTATIDGAAFKGSASLQSPPGTTICTITDRDTRNNSCVCQ